MKEDAVFITGASSGIGCALAQKYAARGATVGLVGRRIALLEELARTLPAAAAPHRVYGVDVTEPGAIAEAARAFMAVQGTPQVVIASAGVSSGTQSEREEDLDVFFRTIETNLLATVATFQPFIAPMRAIPAARLVGIASVAGIRGLPGAAAYCASKSGVISYCESLRVELRASSIRVVTLAPGYIATPMTAHNPYPMPFLMPADEFATRALRMIDRGQSYGVIPWQMAMVAKLLRLMPNWLYDRALAHAPHKPRLND